MIPQKGYLWTSVGTDSCVYFKHPVVTPKWMQFPKGYFVNVSGEPAIICFLGGLFPAPDLCFPKGKHKSPRKLEATIPPVCFKTRKTNFLDFIQRGILKFHLLFRQLSARFFLRHHSAVRAVPNAAGFVVQASSRRRGIRNGVQKMRYFPSPFCLCNS